MKKRIRKVLPSTFIKVPVRVIIGGNRQVPGGLASIIKCYLCGLRMFFSEGEIIDFRLSLLQSNDRRKMFS